MHKILLDNKLVYYQVFLKNNKNIYLRVKNNIVNITAPKSFLKTDIEGFLIKHQSFILKHIDIIKKPLYDTDKFNLWGFEYEINKYDGLNIEFDEQKVNIPKTFTAKDVEKFYKQEVIKEINHLMVNLVREMKEINLVNLSFKSQLMKSRLGSCNTSVRKINLNSILARFDKKYLRAVLIHELVHLNVANHQKSFYSLLYKYVPDYKELRKNINDLVKKIDI